MTQTYATLTEELKVRINPNHIGEGQIVPCDATISEKCLFPYQNTPTLIKQISLFDVLLP